ncbi:MAG TPA: hypothetical protein VIM29_14000 [Bacillota bacterium]
MKCPDCKTDVGYNRVYCPHCSAELCRSQRKKKKTACYLLLNIAGMMRG